MYTIKKYVCKNENCVFRGGKIVETDVKQNEPRYCKFCGKRLKEVGLKEETNENNN